MNLGPGLIDLLRCFSGAGVRFMVVGSHAMAFHGVPRDTADLDIQVDPSEGNAERLAEAFRLFGIPLGAREVALMGQPDNILRFGHPPSRVDVMTTVSGLDFRDAESRIQCFTAGDVSIPCICLANLLENKRASARPKDLVDVATLETLP